MMRKLTFKEVWIVAILSVILSVIVPVLFFYAGILTVNSAIAVNVILVGCILLALLLPVAIRETQREIGWERLSPKEKRDVKLATLAMIIIFVSALALFLYWFCVTR